MARLQVSPLNRLHLAVAILTIVLLIVKKQLTNPCQRVLIVSLQFAIFCPPDPVDRLAEILGDVQPAVHDSRLRNTPSRAADEPLLHAH